MKRIPFVLKILADFDEKTFALPLNASVNNFSAWRIDDFLFCYGEWAQDEPDFCWTEAIPGCEVFAAPGTMRLMYHDIGIVREDKSLIRHRVFATRLHEGCVEEYKRRHDALVEARGDSITQGPESNFTIWHANGYIFGYCELVKSYDHPMTDEERASTIAWETRQLEIMDWLTDDVDWITGETHAPVQKVYAQ